jgi:hypothetical protein
LAIMNRVDLSGPPRAQAKQPRSSSMACATWPSRTRTHLPFGIARPSATRRADPSGVTSATIPGGELLAGHQVETAAVDVRVPRASTTSSLPAGGTSAPSARPRCGRRGRRRSPLACPSPRTTGDRRAISAARRTPGRPSTRSLRHPDRSSRSARVGIAIVAGRDCSRSGSGIACTARAAPAGPEHHRDTAGPRVSQHSTTRAGRMFVQSALARISQHSTSAGRRVTTYSPLSPGPARRRAHRPGA